MQLPFKKKEVLVQSDRDANGYPKGFGDASAEPSTAERLVGSAQEQLPKYYTEEQYAQLGAC